MFEFVKEMLESNRLGKSNAFLAFKGLYRDPVPEVLRNALILDIETGGLDRAAPILQIAIQDTAQLDLAADLSEQVQKVKDVHLFPYALRRDVAKFDEFGNPRTPDHLVRPAPVLSAEDFRSEFGDWAFKDKNKHLKLQELYDSVGGQFTQEHIDELEKVGHITVGDTVWEDPHRYAQKFSDQLKYASKKNMNVVAANNPFEGQRLGLFLGGFLNQGRDSQEWKSLFESSVAYKGNMSIMGGESSQRFRYAKDQLVNPKGDYLKLRPFWGEATKQGLGAPDVQTPAKMLFSGTGALGLTREHADIYSGSSIEYMSHVLLGKKEKHAAGADALYQAEILKYLSPSTERLYNIQVGQESKNLIDRSIGFAHAVGGLWDKEFQRTLAFAHKRTATLEMIKEDSLQKALGRMAGTIDVLSGKSVEGFSFAQTEDGIKPLSGEFFTVTGDFGLPEKRVTPSGETFLDYSRMRKSDPDMLDRVHHQIKTEGVQAAEDSLLEAYRASDAFQGYEGTFDLAAEMKRVRGRIETEGIEAVLQTPDSHKAAVKRAMNSSHYGMGDYASWLVKQYRRPIAGVVGFGAAAAGVAYSLMPDRTVSQYKEEMGPTLGSYLDKRTGLDQSHEGEEVAAFRSPGASSLGYSEHELYRRFTEESNFSDSTSFILKSGTIAHKYEEVKRLRQGSNELGVATSAEAFASDPQRGISSFVDVMYDGIIPSDVKTASPRKMAKIRKSGADRRNVSQLNWYMSRTGADHGYLEYVNRIDPSDTETVRVEFNPELLRRDLAKLDRVRSRVARDVASGRLNEEDLPTRGTMQARHLESVKTQRELRRLADRPFNPLLEMQYRANLFQNQRIEQSRSTSDNRNDSRYHMANAQNEAMARILQSSPGRGH